MANPFPSKKPYFKRNFNRGPRKNERIRVPEVRVISPEGTQLGVLKTQEAIRLAKECGLDLVEVAGTARPPVCRILDSGKYMYEKSKRKGSKPTATKQKEIKFRLNIDKHDYETKVNRGREFLDKGYRLKITLSFRGRELEHENLGFEIVKRAIEDLKEMSIIDAPPKKVGRNITVTLSAIPQSKRKIKPKSEEEDTSE